MFLFLLNLEPSTFDFNSEINAQINDWARLMVAYTARAFHREFPDFGTFVAPLRVHMNKVRYPVEIRKCRLNAKNRKYQLSLQWGPPR